MNNFHMQQSDYNFKEMTDEQVVVIAQQEQNEFAIDYIVNKYKNFVRAKARTYFLVGADRDDIIQEGMIGLYKAARDFRHDKLASFRAFAELCITRQIITAIKSATRQKHAPLNSYISLNKPVYTEESERTLLEMLSSARSRNPEDSGKPSHHDQGQSGSIPPQPSRTAGKTENQGSRQRWLFSWKNRSGSPLCRAADRLRANCIPGVASEICLRTSH